MKKRMNIKDARKEQEQPKPAKAPHQISLPGWISTEEELGLGEAMKRVFYRAGIKACEGCNRRAAALDRNFVLKRR
jgi:hypothetical protein